MNINTMMENDTSAFINKRADWENVYVIERETYRLAVCMHFTGWYMLEDDFDRKNYYAISDHTYNFLRGNINSYH